MEKFDKILELLEKTSISTEEQEYIENARKSDNEIEKLIRVFNSLKNNLPKLIHLDVETIASYILYENGDEPEIKSINLLADKIKEHLSKCKLCKLDYDNLRQEYFITNEFVKTSINDRKHLDKIQTPIWGIFKAGNVFKYSFAAIVVLVMLYTGLYFYSNSTIKLYEKDLFNSTTEEVYSTRGRTTLIFQKGLDAVEHGDYEAAVNFFKEDINENKNDQSIFYTYYVLGITQLHTSEESFIGLFRNYDLEKVNSAIASLKRAIELNTSGNYENINLDAQYYLGRAYLLKGNINKAEENLKIVIGRKGRFYHEAKELIETISSGL